MKIRDVRNSNHQVRSEIFWTCDPCKVLMEPPCNAHMPPQVFCPTCAQPMQYHGPMRQLSNVIDIRPVEDMTPRQLPAPKKEIKRK